MSTFFHSAAMSLLSKTLRSLLYKYLSDVDVEGVALPSLYNSDGHSGWGVRLSNVKLREGAKLMDLPGKPVKKTKKKQAKRRKNIHKTSSRLKETKEDQFENEGSTPSVNEANHDTIETEADPVVTKPSQSPTTVRSSSWFSWYLKKSSTLPESTTGDTSKGEDLSTTVRSDKRKTSGADLEEEEEDTEDEEEADETSSSGEEYGSDDGEADEEPPMILRLGTGGTIGMLDVRLVGKDIQILVEDACLTIEAVQLATSQDGVADGARSEVKPKKKKNIPTPKTVGDRVLAENAIARIISMIPNLFLRDIRIRFVVREEPGDEIHDDKPLHYSLNDTIAEIHVELFSVTDGQDFMANFRETDDDSSADDASSANEADPDRANSLANTENLYNQMEYLVKRVRTGRGPEGGISLHIFPPGEKGIVSHFGGKNEIKWARQKWKSATEFCVLRCSGIDIHARIFMGTRKEIALVKNTWFADEYDEYTVNTMLFGGVDYIAPGPQPTLPPFAGISNQDFEEEKLWTRPGASKYEKDINGIYSSGIPSCFHRIARGLSPEVCDGGHLPCEYCDRCWSAPPGVPLTHSLDQSLPMGGLVLSCVIRDVLEINVDRPVLDALGMFLTLFRGKERGKEREDVADKMERDFEFSETGKLGMDESERSVRSLTSKNSFHANPSSREDDAKSSLLLKRSRSQDENFNTPTLTRSSSYGSNAKQQNRNPNYIRKVSGGSNDLEPTGYRSPRHATNKQLENNEHLLADSFPSYIQPEKLQILGLYLSKLNFRLQLLQGNRNVATGSSFAYWETTASCITLDMQALATEDKSCTDLRLDVGFLNSTEFAGAEKRQLVSIGTRQRVVDFDEMTFETFMSTRSEDNQRPPWPNTAAALLELQPPLESLVYEDRDRHALQLRLISFQDDYDCLDWSRSHFNVRLGVTSIDVPSTIPSIIKTTLDEVKSSFLGLKTRGEPPEKSELPQSLDEMRERNSLMKCKFFLDGGRVRYSPIIDAQFPTVTFRGDRSSSMGLSFETLLRQIHLKYGMKFTPTIGEGRRLSLKHLADLPDNVRLRILLFLKDLKPLEIALNAKPEANQFLRCRAVNKHIVLMARQLDKNSEIEQSHDARLARRQQITTEILKLDDSALEELWDMHELRLRRVSRNKFSNR